jgi:hypothetical protein
MSKLSNRVQILSIVVVAAIVGSALATGAFAGRKHVPRWRISAYSHPLVRAHRASAAPIMPLAGVTGASLAAVKGTNEVFIGHRSVPTTLDCFWEHTSSGGHGGCEKASVVESQGVVSMYEASEGATSHILAFVPDGVGSVVVTDKDGSAHTVQVTNNLAVYEDPRGPSSVSFTLPNGATQTTDVSAWRTPQRPGSAPGSSK